VIDGDVLIACAICT